MSYRVTELEKEKVQELAMRRYPTRKIAEIMLLSESKVYAIEQTLSEPVRRYIAGVRKSRRQNNHTGRRLHDCTNRN